VLNCQEGILFRHEDGIWATSA